MTLEQIPTCCTFSNDNTFGAYFKERKDVEHCKQTYHAYYSSEELRSTSCGVPHGRNDWYISDAKGNIIMTPLETVEQQLKELTATIAQMKADAVKPIYEYQYCLMLKATNEVTSYMASNNHITDKEADEWIINHVNTKQFLVIKIEETKRERTC